MGSSARLGIGKTHLPSARGDDTVIRMAITILCSVLLMLSTMLPDQLDVPKAWDMLNIVHFSEVRERNTKRKRDYNLQSSE